MKIERTILSLCIYALLIPAFGCNKSSEGSSVEDDTSSSVEQELPCEFTSDGRNYTGQGSTQIFPATKEFSVLCQSSGDDGKLVQFVFRDEMSARSGTTFKIVKDIATRAEGADEVSLTFDLTYSSTESTEGSVAVSKSGAFHEVHFVGVPLFKVTGEKVAISGKIAF